MLCEWLSRRNWAARGIYIYILGWAEKGSCVLRALTYEFYNILQTTTMKITETLLTLQTY